MKKLITVILLLSITAQSFSQVIIQARFYLNRGYISRNLCENRFRPMLHCNGKCVLAKKLKQEEKKDEQAPDRKMPGKEEISSYSSFFNPVILISDISGTNRNATSDNTIVDRPASIFHPPWR